MIETALQEKNHINTSFIFRSPNNRISVKGKERGLMGILAFAKNYRILAKFTFTVIKERERTKEERKYSVSGTFSANPERKKF